MDPGDYKELKAFLMSDIDGLGFSNRTANSFRDSNLKYVAQIYAILGPELLGDFRYKSANSVHLPNFGPQALKEVLSNLASRLVPIGSLTLQNKDRLIPEREDKPRYWFLHYPYGDLDQAELDFFLSPNDVSFDPSLARQLKDSYSLNSITRVDLAIFIVEKNFKGVLENKFLDDIIKKISLDPKFADLVDSFQKRVSELSAGYQYVRGCKPEHSPDERSFWLIPEADKFQYSCVSKMLPAADGQTHLSRLSSQFKSAAMREIAKDPDIIAQINAIETYVIDIANQALDRVYDRRNGGSFTQTPQTPSSPFPK